MSTALSIIMICHNMRREAPRTLFSMSRYYQRGVEDLEYEVLVVDNGSSEPLSDVEVRRYGPEFKYWYYPTSSHSPVSAINAAVKKTSGRHVAICIDGARIISPGMLRHIDLATRLSERAIITSLAWHLGDKIQKISMLSGYDQNVEDRLLDSVDWKADGYELFSISCLAKSSGDGWFQPIAESSCIAVSRELYKELNGFDERFTTPGGGYAALDFYKRACDAESTDLINLLGEGTFHQFHGGIATNSRPEVHPGKLFAEEYRELRGANYRKPTRTPLYLGRLPRAAWPFLRLSADRLEP